MRPDVLGRAQRELGVGTFGAQRLEQPGRECRLADREPGDERDVIEQEQEPGHAGVEQRLQLPQQRGPIRFGLVGDVEAGGDGEAEPDAEIRRVRGELSEPTHFVGVVQLSPSCTVLRIVLRCIRVCVHSTRREERTHVEARRVRPRLAVEAFDHASYGE